MADTDVIAKLSALGDAVRYKGGFSDAMTLDEMASRIRGLDSGMALNRLLQGDAVTLEASASSIRDRACEYHYTLPGVSLPFAETIGAYAFQFCSDLTRVDLPAATLIKPSAFYSCQRLTDLSLPSVVTIQDNAFRACTDLSQVTLPACETIGSSAFQQCSDLTRVDAPEAGTIQYAAFFQCSNLSELLAPNATLVGLQAFQNCVDLTRLDLGRLGRVNQSAFQNCQNLSEMALPMLSYVESSAFRDCYRLTGMDLTGIWSVPYLANANAFDQTPLRNNSTYTGAWGSIYVPSQLYPYISTWGQWSYMTSRFASVAHAEGALVDAFPDGVRFPTTSGVTVTESSAGEGVASFTATQSGAGSYGITVALDGLTEGTCYAVGLDLTVAGESYRTGNYRLGLYASPTEKSNFGSYDQWLDNVERDGETHHYTWTFTAIGETGYLDIITSGLNTGSHTIDAANLTVHECTYQIGA